MAIEGEVMTIHQKIAEAHKRNKGHYGMSDDKPMRSFDAPKVSDIEEIKQVLQYILDKLHGMDKWMRLNLEPRYRKEFEAHVKAETARADANAEAMGLPSVNKLNETINKELAKYGNDSKEVNSGIGEDRKQISGSGSCATRQGDFRAGNPSNPEMEPKDNDSAGAKKVDDKSKA